MEGGLMAEANPWLAEGATLGIGYAVVAESMDDEAMGPPQLIIGSAGSREAAASQAIDRVLDRRMIDRFEDRDSLVDSLKRGECKADGWHLLVIPVTITVRGKG